VAGVVEYDLASLFQHPLKFRFYIPSAIVAFGGQQAGQFEVKFEWKRSPTAEQQTNIVRLRWDIATLKTEFADIEDELVFLDPQEMGVQNHVSSLPVVRVGCHCIDRKLPEQARSLKSLKE
jgi:hypothetical protein